MKKFMLICVILCASQLYGMENEKREEAFQQLPIELHQIITQTALKSSTTVDEAIKAIQNASAVYGGLKLDETAAIHIFNQMLPNDIDQAIEAIKNLQGSNLKDFTALISILTKKFPTMQRETIAQKINTPIADQYLRLGKSFHGFIQGTNSIKNGLLSSSDSKQILENTKKLLSEGMDPNYSWKSRWGTIFSSLSYTFFLYDLFRVKISTLPVAKLLLEYGAKPDDKVIEKIKGLIKDITDDNSYFSDASEQKEILNLFINLVKQHENK